jgi:hypothetical protein
MIISWYTHYLLAASILFDYEAAVVYGVRGGTSGDVARPTNNNNNKPRQNNNAIAVLQHLKGGASTKRRKRKWSEVYEQPTWMQIPPPPLVPRATAPRGEAVLAPPRQPQQPAVVINHKSTAPSFSIVDISVAAVYFCCAFAITLPIILTPMIAESYQLSSPALTSFCATVASVGLLGGGVGKVVNGIVCQRMGGVATASMYALGLGLSSFALSCSTSLHSAQWMVAATEFCSSAIWVACSLILSNHYSKKPLLFARGVTYLSLASTGGQLFAKTVGSALLQFTDWRRLAQIGGLVGVLGSLVMRFVVAQQMYMEEPKHHLFGRSVSSSSASLSGVMNKVKDVLSSRLFWMVGLAHVSGYLARTCDRMMGPFLKDVTALPRTYTYRMVEPRRLQYRTSVMVKRLH